MNTWSLNLIFTADSKRWRRLSICPTLFRRTMRTTQASGTGLFDPMAVFVWFVVFVCTALMCKCFCQAGDVLQRTNAELRWRVGHFWTAAAATDQRGRQQNRQLSGRLIRQWPLTFSISWSAKIRKKCREMTWENTHQDIKNILKCTKIVHFYVVLLSVFLN